MKKKWLTLNLFILVGFIFLLIWIFLSFSFNETVLPSEECVDVNKVASLVYDSCYDAYSKNIFLEVERNLDSYKINALDISFFDFSEKTYKLSDVPSIKEGRAYKIPAEKNPQYMDVSLDIVKDFSSSICKEPRTLFIKYCPVGIQKKDVNASISPLGGVNFEDFIEIQAVSSKNSDLLDLSLVDKERIWKSSCESIWDCKGWGDCDDGFQRRECRDVKGCFIPTDVPDTVRSCDGGCVENWECEWSDCSSGFTVPKCKDLNDCGTSYDILQRLECGNSKLCVPSIKCEDWSSCNINYTFIDLVESPINELSGVKSRLCVDANGCSDSQEETKACLVNVDIYTNKFSKCGEEFVGVYNKLDNELIARVSEGTEDVPYLNINLDGEESVYCDYCFNGRIDGDEEDIDCGGSCIACTDKYRSVDFRRRSWLDTLSDWIKRILI